MLFNTYREEILKPLTQVCSVVEKRQTLPILANVFLKIDGNTLTMTGTDLEVEVTTWIELESIEKVGRCTVNARKFLDICRALPTDAKIQIETDKEQLNITAGKAKFNLRTLDAEDYPYIETQNWQERFRIKQSDLSGLIANTGFSMAQQDVRYYLNGLLFDIKESSLVSVATDGHRLAKAQSSIQGEISNENGLKIIVPRKAILELSRMLEDNDEMVTIELNKHHIRFTLADSVFTSKLIDGKFPDYETVMSVDLPLKLNLSRVNFLDILQRASILTNEKFRGIRLTFSNNVLTVTSNNPEQEQATDEMTVDYTGEELEVGFNVNYIIDVLKHLSTEEVSLSLRDPNSSCTLQATDDKETKYLIMPMRI